MADWAVVEGFACYGCGSRRCCCEAMEAERAAELEKEERTEHRTNRLLRACDAAEARVDFLYALTEKHPGLPEALERLNNLNRALMNHRRATFTEIF